MPAFLPERVRGDPRIENGVKIDIDQIVKVPEILARDRIAGLIRKGHGIEEGVQRALHELDEWFLDRVLARAAKHGVLEDVSDAGQSRGGVRKMIPNTLFSSSLMSERSSAPVLA
jgi:hypothetical protein